MAYRMTPGAPYPLGATWDGCGVNFALFSENAEKVELCLFEKPDDPVESARIPLTEQTAYVWHGYFPDLRPGQRYGYRISGPWDPERGLRFNHHKLLLDPYARALSGRISWDDSLFAYPMSDDPDRDLQFDDRDNASGMPRCVVIEPAFSWGDDVRPNTPLHETIIYEAHVRGLTMRHPDLPDNLRGTYAGMADHRIIRYLQELGVTAVELMPVHAFIDDKHLVDRGLSNYWGYNSIAFFAPEPRYAASRGPGAQVNEFKTMVKSLHRAGIEVILDVVYNHTAEGNHYGPTLSFRGIDNTSYYRLTNGGRHYMDYTGTGNTLNMLHPRTVQLIMDSLRYWATEMHVDGFRFDLAASLARELHEVDRLSAFFDIIHQDPVLSQLKLIAEPWDVGEGGYQVGNFPVLWAEWNGKYRDTVRKYWKGDFGQVSDLGYRLTGSSDLYAHNGRRPYASVNFITAHDGFTLHDLVSYNDKHNEANGEENRDGHNDNASWNHGVEGPTDDREILALRQRQMRNMMATLLVSQGVPMILHGDEVARTQGGNNNAYCQDNETTWQNWDLSAHERQMLDWTRRCVAFRKEHSILRRRNYFQGRPIRGAGIKDIAWLRPDGVEMSDEEWNDPGVRALAVWLGGLAGDKLDQRGNRIIGHTLLILMNAHEAPVTFKLPPTLGTRPWEVGLDTARPELPEFSERHQAGSEVELPERSMMVLRDPTLGIARPANASGGV